MAPQPPKKKTKSNTGKAASKSRKLTGDDEKDFAKCLHAVESSKSTAYKNYHPPELHADGLRHKTAEEDGTYAALVTFRCNVCNRYALDQPVKFSGTRNLASHTKTCTSAQAALEKLSRLEAHGFAGGEADDDEIFQAWVIECACNGRPFKMSKDEELQPLLSGPARKKSYNETTIGSATSELAGYGRENLKERLKRVKGLIYLMLDGWATPNHQSIIGLLVRIREAVLGGFKTSTLALDFAPIFDAHKAKNMADLVLERLEYFGIEGKVAGITSDSASNMVAMAKEIGQVGHLDGKATFVRCFVHIINLFFKAVMQSFARIPRVKDTATGKKLRKGDDLVTIDWTAEEQYEALNLPPSDDLEAYAALAEFLDETENDDNEAVNTHFDEMDAEEAYQGDDFVTDEKERTAHSFKNESPSDAYNTFDCSRALVKLQLITQKLAFSTPAKNLFVTLCREMNVATPHNVPRAVKTRFYSALESMVAAVRCEEAIKKWQGRREVNWPQANKLSDEDFALFRALIGPLQPAKDFILRFSVTGAPLIAEVIPVIDRFSKMLDKSLFDPKTVPALHNALLRGWKLFQKYYGLTDESLFYRAAILMHPSMGISWMRRAKWPQEWIDKAVTVVQAYWEKRHGSTFDDDETPEVIVEDSRPFEDLDIIEQMRLEALAATQAARSAPSAPRDNMILHYASSEPKWKVVDGVAQAWDPIEYWEMELAAGRSVKDGIAQFAIDLFNCPASTIDVERAFSLGRRLCADSQHGLSVQRIADLMTVAFYSKNGIIKPGLLMSKRADAKLNRKVDRKRKRDEEAGRQASLGSMVLGGDSDEGEDGEGGTAGAEGEGGGGLDDEESGEEEGDGEAQG